MSQPERRKPPRCGRKQACENCRRRKERCDGQRPCSRCRMRGVAGECDCRDRSNNSASLQPGHPLSPSPRQRRRNFSDCTLPDPDEMSLPQECPNETTIMNNPFITPSPLGPGLARNSQFFPDRHGEYIFVGQSSTLSVLQRLQLLVRGALGPCSFVKDTIGSELVDDEPSESMDLAGVSMAPQLPSEEDVRYCIRWYARATNCVFDLFSYNELVENVIPWLGDKRPSASKSCINFLVLAIGAQCGPRDMEREANAYFMHGRYLALSQFLEEPRIVTVQIYALLAMYLLNASRRNAASMYLSVAVRTAYALGIHRPDATALFSATEASFRERVWKVLRILDLFLSTSLGHSPSTAETRDTGSQRGYSASNDLCYIFEKILCELYEKQEVQPSALHHVSTHHREWAARFHEGLQVDHISADEYVGDEPGSKQLNIGLLHFKEAYYWTIMLCSFPYLLELVQRRITNFSDPLPLPATNNVCAELLPQRDTLLAHASVNSAVLTIVLLRGLLHAREIPKRLPFVVNSVFTSCLVLGASFFADLDCVFPVEETLLTAEKLLDLFQQHDSLARRELAIVRSLRSACNEFVKQRHERWLKHQGVLIQGLFGDPKFRQTNTRESSRSCSSVQTPLSMRGTGLTTSGLSRENFVSLQSPSHIQLESNAIWDDLFGDNAPIHLCGSDIQQTEAGAQLMNMSEEVDFPSSLSFLAGDEAAGLRSAGTL